MSNYDRELIEEFMSLGYTELDATIAVDLAQEIIKQTLEFTRDRIDQLSANQPQKVLTTMVFLSFFNTHTEEKLKPTVHLVRLTGRLQKNGVKL